VISSTLCRCSGFSLLSLARHALSRHRGWQPMWRKPAPKPRYSVVIVGGGGHGLATAYYLAKEHGIRDVAVVDKGPIGLGNTGRNTTIIRSNYLWDESARLYEHSLKLWEGLSAELNFNLMLSQRGVLNLAHSEADIREGRRRVFANRANGIDAEWLDPAGVKAFCPILSMSPDARIRSSARRLQRRGGVARHDAVAWGFARAADALGVDIIRGLRGVGDPHRKRARHRGRDEPRHDRPPKRSRSRQPDTIRYWRRWPGCGCRCKATRCRRWCRSR